MGPLTGIIPGKRVHTHEGELPLDVPTLKRQPARNRAQRRAAQRDRR